MIFLTKNHNLRVDVVILNENYSKNSKKGLNTSRKKVQWCSEGVQCVQ
jgi:hypothetical protein